MVFPGLTAGASLGPPMVRPPNMAAVSHTQVTTRGKNTSHAPDQDLSAKLVCRMASRKAGSAPVYPTARRVMPAADNGRSVGARAASTQLSRSSSQMAARYGHQRPTQRRTSPVAITPYTRSGSAPALSNASGLTGRTFPRPARSSSSRAPSAPTRANTNASGAPPYQMRTRARGIATTANPTRRTKFASMLIRLRRGQTAVRAAETPEWPRRGVAG